jgi:hypothetical protein
MKLKLVKASQGLMWVRQGILACRQQPLGFVGLLGLFGCVALLMVGLPARIGSMLVVGVMPVMWMGFMLATRRVLTGQRITLSVMFESLKGPDAPRRQFAMLGGVYVVVTLLVMQIAQWLGPDPDALEKIMTTTEDAAELFTNPLVQEDMLWRMLLTIPVSLIFWHTPALILWAKLPVPKALFFSAVATWRNIGAFMTYGLGWLGIMLVIALLDRALLAIIPEPLIANMAAIVASMWLAAAFYASLYFTVVDCFEPQKTPPDA